VYVRLDGQRVGTGADIARVGGEIGGVLDTGIWQNNTGSYLPFGWGFVWTGAILGFQGTIAGTCGNWADPTQEAGIVGLSMAAGTVFYNYMTKPCTATGDDQASLYCFEP
jgi:hypothetical protein